MSKGYKDEIVLAAHARKSTPAFLSISLERHSGAAHLLASGIIFGTRHLYRSARSQSLSLNGIPTSVAISVSAYSWPGPVPHPGHILPIHQGGKGARVASRIAPWWTMGAGLGLSDKRSLHYSRDASQPCP